MSIKNPKTEYSKRVRFGKKSDVEVFYQKIGFSIKRKQDKLEAYIAGGKHNPY